jgi:putative endopeptidase
LSRTLSIATLLAAIALPALAAERSPTPSPEIVSPEPEEAEASSHLRFDPSLVDRTASPCQDLYQFACGGWLKANPIPPDEAAWGRYAQLTDRNREMLAQAIEAAGRKKGGLDENTRKILDYYETCMDEASAERLGLTPVEPILRQIASLGSPRDIVLEAGRLRRTGIPALFALSAIPDPRDARGTIAEVDQGGLGLPDRDYYTNHGEKVARLLEQYRAHVAKTFELTGESAELAAREAHAAVFVETALALGSQTRVERRDPDRVYNRMSPSELKKLAPDLPWEEYFDTVGLKLVSPVNVASPGYFKALETALRAASLEDWKSYLRWTVLRENAPRLNAALEQENFRFFGRTLHGVTEPKPRASRCVMAVDRDLRDIVGQIYVKSLLMPAVKRRVEIIVSLLQGAMKADLARISWMDDDTRSRAQDKLKALVTNVAYPGHWVDMSKVQIGRTSWPANAEQAARFRFDRDLEKIGKPTDRTEWQMAVAAVRASYDPLRNALTLPAGILQPPFYDLWMDDAPTFGAIGWVTARELSRGFDEHGSHFNAEGSVREWWSTRTATAFARRAACVEKQLSGYAAAEDLEVDGKLALGEYVADVGGLKIAYAAFQDAVRGVRSQMPDKVQGFTPEQRFFIGFAQSQCRMLTPEEQRLRTRTGPYLPSRIRVNGSLSGMREFQEAFQCSKEAAPVRKATDDCALW